jgi:hypothetical protein
MHTDSKEMRQRGARSKGEKQGREWRGQKGEPWEGTGEEKSGRGAREREVGVVVSS